MGLTQLTLNCALGWAESKTNTGFAATKFGPASDFFNLLGIDLGDVDELAALKVTSLAASATHTVDLTNLQNLVGESFAFDKVMGLFVKPVGSGSELTFGTGASNGLDWIFDGGALVVPPGCGFCFAAAVGDTGTAVDSMHKTLDFTNSGASTMTSLTIYIWGLAT